MHVVSFPVCEISNLAHNICKQISFLPGYETAYLGTKVPSRVQNDMLAYETFYLGMKLSIGYETFCLGMKLFTLV
jgi:hypothetical protein